MDVLIWLLLILPYGVLLLGLSDFEQSTLKFEDLSWALMNTLEQSALSAIFSLTVGFLLSLGLLQLRGLRPFSKRMKLTHSAIEGILLVPSFLPPIIIILITFYVVSPFPFGVIGIALAHTFTYAGLVAVHLARLFKDRLTVLSFLSRSHGASAFFFWSAALKSLRVEIVGLALLVFSACATSFSIPLVMGGGRGTTLEVLVYERFIIERDFSSALALALIQLLLIVALNRISGFWSARSVSMARAASETSRSFLSWKITSPGMGYLGLFTICVYLFCFFMPIFKGGLEGLQDLQSMESILVQLLKLSITSLALAVLTGVAIALTLFLAVSLFCTSKTRNWLNAWSTPPTALVGMAAFIMVHQFDSMSQLRWFVYGTSMLVLTLPTLYRMGVQDRLRRLTKLEWLSSSWGASPWTDLLYRIVPELWTPIWKIAGIGAIWTLGDFALGKMFLSSESTVALMAESLMNSYRLEAGIAVSVYIMLLSLLVWLIFSGVASVRSKES